MKFQTCCIQEREKRTETRYTKKKSEMAVEIPGIPGVNARTLDAVLQGVLHARQCYHLQRALQLRDARALRSIAADEQRRRLGVARGERGVLRVAASPVGERKHTDEKK